MHCLSFLKTQEVFWLKVSLKTFWWGLSFWQILLRWQESTNNITFCPPYWISSYECHLSLKKLRLVKNLRENPVTFLMVLSLICLVTTQILICENILLLEQHLMPVPNHLIFGHTNPYDLLFCPTMISLGLSVRQSDIFKDFTYLSLTWIKPFSVQFAKKKSTFFERVYKVPMMPF